MSTSIRPASTRTIGLIADWFDERYQHSILTTLEEAAAQRGASLRAFAGGIPGSRARDSELRNRGLQLAKPDNVDGAIVLAGTLVNALGSDGLHDLLRPLGGIPLCSVGVELPGTPSIVIDNQAGIDQAMHHLVAHHGCRDVAFIRGPNRNKEAESRFAAYRAALQQAEIPYNPKLTYQGNFLQQSGAEAVAYWRSLDMAPKAIIAANDEMALGALRALVMAGVRVPEEVRVVGFDDISLAKQASPPLTTVRQPLTELAVTSVRTVMDQLNGREVPMLQMLQTHLVVRDSCGCDVRLTSSGRSLLPDEESTSGSQGFETEFARARPALRRELARIARGEFLHLREWEDRLMTSFAEQVASNGGAFTQLLGQFLSRSAGTGGNIVRFQDIVTAFRRTALPCCGPNLAQRTQIENVLQEARLAVALAVEREHQKAIMLLHDDTRSVVEAAAALTGSFSLERLQTALKERLPALGISICAVVGYTPLQLSGMRSGESPPERAAVLAAYTIDGDVLKTPQLPLEFATELLAPAEVLPPDRVHHVCVLPLFHDGHELGYCIVESNKRQTPLFELLREQLSVALYGCILAQTATNPR